jgi:putative ABC transport system permease protein
MVPLKYNLRNLWVRRGTTLMTVAGTALIVWSSCILFSMVEGLQHSLDVSGDPLDLIILRKGSTNETDGGFELDKADTMVTLKGVARDPKLGPLVSRELLNIPVMERSDGSRTNLIVRGMDPIGRLLRRDFTITNGRDLEPGKGEAIISERLSGRFKNSNLGDTLKVGEKESYRVVGLFRAGGGSAESEIWVDRKDLERNIAREGSVSSVQIRAASPAEMDDIRNVINNDAQYKLLAESEKDYFNKQQQSSTFLKVFGTLIAVLLTIGAMLAASNTMFGAVASRTREIGTMRALGFSRTDVLISFLGESVILCTIGGVVGLLMTLPLTALSFGTVNSNTFSEATVNFRFGPLVMGVAFAMTMAMGVLGGLFPALKAINKDVIASLREL